MILARTRTGFATTVDRALWLLQAALILTLGLVDVQADDSVNQIETGHIESRHGCSVAYERHSPDDELTREVILAHGFMRSLEHMRGWAELWRQEGIAVTLVSFCNSSWFNGHHQRNADDLVAIRKKLGLGQVVYAGFSAGGLAAYLAAGSDDQATAYLGLDSVDSNDLAQEAPNALSVPSLFIMGDPSMCNAQRNFQSVFDKWPQYNVRSIAGASHCHFELPYDRKCAWLCGGNSKAEDTVGTQQKIQKVAMEWLMRD